ncbi:MAG TPA: enoyl-CoA hydratase-related protein [Marmoricola sp.]|nr:enoyl-CoA hydratase-related protein [Marmoricola sp.]HNO40856.1 enoyl-CoA hydratase-related protein [Marmoricola sp.]
MTELVHLEVAEGVGTITLDSPANRNALSRQLVTELMAAIESVEQDPAARVVVLRSSERVFCSGADLSEAAEGAMEEGAQALVEMQRRIIGSAKPYVCLLAGPVRAGGLGLVGSCDLVLCAEEVTFAFTESRLGLAPAVISLSLLPRLTSRAAADVFLSGRTFTATEAAAMGLVTRVVPAAELAGALRVVLEELGAAHPQGLAETKALLNTDLLAHLDQYADQVVAQSVRLFGSDAAREAMLAFLSRK